MLCHSIFVVAAVAGERVVFEGTARWKQIITPPFCAVFTGAIIGLTPARSYVVSNVVFDSMVTLGGAAIPMAMILLGASLAKGPTSSSVSKGICLSLCLLRLLLMPAFGLLFYYALHSIHVLPTDKIVLLVLLVESCTPTATNMVVVCQLHQQNEVVMGTMLFYQYLIAPATLTGAVFVMLLTLN